LKKVVIAFQRLGPKYACVQCLLNFYNPRKNMLTRWFSIEYSYYYDFYIQGLDKIDAPIPLGGTSNHFRMKTLRELGAWDPYNVTEDADLGMRIARKKLHTAVLNSHTYEEAVSRIPSWIKQRSRWVKGFVITWFVTMRHPIRVLQDIGLKNFLVFQTGFGGNFYLPLMNLFLWLIFAASFIIPDYFSRWFDFWPFAVIAVFNLLVGNLFFLTMMVIATWKEKQRDLF
jgi:cellulose synthase/poly-beta-1,6-N-acetylglucosamine synthase-like glycosyltransferase